MDRPTRQSQEGAVTVSLNNPLKTPPPAESLRTFPNELFLRDSYQFYDACAYLRGHRLSFFAFWHSVWEHTGISNIRLLEICNARSYTNG